MLSIQYLSFKYPFILFAELTDTQSFLNPEVLEDDLFQTLKKINFSQRQSFKESKKSNTDLRRTGLVTLFTGIGLTALGKFGLSLDVLFGVGLLVMFIGFGQIIAGYVYE